MFDVAAIGECCVDLVGIVNAMPRENTKKDVSSFKHFVGGSALNATITLTNLGLKTAFIGKIGNDAYGKFIKETLEGEKIGTDTLKVDGKTPFHFVLITKKNQSRTIFKQTRKSSIIDDLSDFHKFILKSSRVLLLDRKAEKIGREAVSLAKKSGVLISFDPSDKFNNFTKYMLKNADIFVAPHGFIKYLKNNNDPKKALMEIWNINRKLVILTLGPNGCIATNGKKFISKPRYDRVKIVDTNGAGDVFHGALVYAILNRWSLAKACEFANKIAALKCSILGNRLKKLDLKKHL